MGKGMEWTVTQRKRWSDQKQGQLYLFDRNLGMCFNIILEKVCFVFHRRDAGSVKSYIAPETK